MSNSLRSSRALWLLAVAAVATLLLSTAYVRPAAAHGSVANPISRNYGCWQRWGGDFQNPRMATEDPMCWQAWQTDTNAMWNWNGLYREGVAGNHQAAIPNGQLCSGGRTENGRYRAMDVPGAWRTTSVGNSFRLKFYDQASHGADYIRVYATRQGYDALTTPLAWSHLELVGQIGNTPASQWQQEPGGVSIEIPVNARGAPVGTSSTRSGRPVTPTSRTTSAATCSSAADPTLRRPRRRPPRPHPRRRRRPPTATGRGLLGDVPGHLDLVRRIPGRGPGDRRQRRHPRLAVNWTNGSGQQVNQAWNATVTSSGSTVTATNVSYNGNLGAGASTSFGFLASGSSTNTPTLTCTATS